MIHDAGPSPFAGRQAEGGGRAADRNLERAERGGQQGGYHPENREGADKASADNDLSTGHSSPSDGGADNAKSGNSAAN